MTASPSRGDSNAPKMGVLALACLLVVGPPMVGARAGTLTPNAPPAPAAASVEPTLAASVADPLRSPRFVARDGARHPLQELTFFGLTPSARVIEIWPGGGYWTEILAPYLRKQGQYTAALPDEVGTKAEIAETHASAAALRARLASDPARFDRGRLIQMGDDSPDLGPAGSADVVLTFRNLHNWMAQGIAEPMFAAFWRVLRPGGVLGIEEHRASPTRPQDPAAASGYVRQDYAIDLARHAGFVLEASSEVNANPKDTTDWPAGVWTLPPTLRLGDRDRAKYLAIGEADNFVLRFRKPLN